MYALLRDSLPVSLLQKGLRNKKTRIETLSQHYGILLLLLLQKGLRKQGLKHNFGSDSASVFLVAKGSKKTRIET